MSNEVQNQKLVRMFDYLLDIFRRKNIIIENKLTIY